MDRSVLQSPPKKESGQSLVEFAVMLTLLLIMVAGIVDAARALFTYLSLRDAAQEGALYASTRPTDTDGIEARVRNASNMLSNLGGEINVVVEPTVTGQLCMGATGGVSHGVRVTVNYPRYPLAMPLLGEIIGREDGTVPISASAIDTILTPACP